MCIARPTDEERRAGVVVLEWVHSTAENDEEIAAADPLTRSAAVQLSKSFLQGALASTREAR
jgi:hypothetical protein